MGLLVVEVRLRAALRMVLREQLSARLTNPSLMLIELDSFGAKPPKIFLERAGAFLTGCSISFFSTEMTLQAWRTLLEELEVTGAPGSSCVSADLAQLEVELGITFPADYKEFCEVFGSGELGGFIRIFCPCSAATSERISENSLSSLVDLQGPSGLDALKQELSWELGRFNKGASTANSARLSKLERILSAAFVFGDDPNAQVYLWDLSSFDQTRQTCDIYLIPTDDLLDATYIGRDFFEFVRDFCLGSKAREVLPSQFKFYEEFTGKTFLRFG
jgi:hypothetical protein